MFLINIVTKYKSTQKMNTYQHHKNISTTNQNEYNTLIVRVISINDTNEGYKPM